MFTTAWGFPVRALGPWDGLRTRCTALFFLCGSQCWFASSLGPEFCVGLAALLQEILGYGIVFALLAYIYIYLFFVWVTILVWNVCVALSVVCA